MDHPDHLSTFFVNSSGIEVVDLYILLGFDGMCRRTCIFYKLTFSKCFDITDALDHGVIHLRTEGLVSKDCQTLFQCQLEPVSTGNTVTRPVVKVLMSDHTLYPHKVLICRRIFIG